MQLSVVGSPSWSSQEAKAITEWMDKYLCVCMVVGLHNVTLVPHSNKVPG